MCGRVCVCVCVCACAYFLIHFLFVLLHSIYNYICLGQGYNHEGYWYLKTLTTSQRRNNGDRERERWNEHERTDCIALLQAACCLSVSSFIFLTHSAKLRVAKLLPQISSKAARASHRQQQSLPCLQLTTLRGSLGTRRALPLSPIAVATCFSSWVAIEFGIRVRTGSLNSSSTHLRPKSGDAMICSSRE